MRILRASAAAMLLACVSMPCAAQTAAPQAASDEVTVIAQGWAALGRSDASQAAILGGKALAQYPRSAAALALAVEAEIRRAHADAGLAVYEHWLGTRPIEDVYVVRRIATEFLREALAKPGSTRNEALRALAADGDYAADLELAKPAFAGNFADTKLLASLGDARAVNILIAQLNSPGGSKLDVIDALVKSRNPQVVGALMPLLKDDIHTDSQAAAADGLGKLGARSAIPQLKALLDSPLVQLRISAASALYRMDDASGLQVLMQQAADPHAAVRLSALELMSSHPDAVWLAALRDTIRALDQESNTSQLLVAARLLAPFDPDGARVILDKLFAGTELAVHEEAARIMAEIVTTDFAALRRLLRDADALVRIRAASKILDLTR